MADVKRVRAVEKGFAPLQPGMPHQRIRPGVIFTVATGTKGTWFVDLDPEPEPAKSPSPRRKKPEDPAPEAEVPSASE